MQGKITFTRDDLYQLEQQLFRLKKDNQLLSFLLGPQIKKFIMATYMESQVTNSRYNAILKEFVEMNEQGELVITEVNGNKEYKIKGNYQDSTGTLFFGDDVKDLFNKRMAALMHQPITIVFNS